MVQILGVVKKNPLFLHEIEWKNGFLFTIPNIYIYIYLYHLCYNIYLKYSVVLIFHRVLIYRDGNLSSLRLCVFR